MPIPLRNLLKDLGDGIPESPLRTATQYIFKRPVTSSVTNTAFVRCPQVFPKWLCSIEYPTPSSTSIINRNKSLVTGSFADDGWAVKRKMYSVAGSIYTTRQVQATRYVVGAHCTALLVMAQ